MADIYSLNPDTGEVFIRALPSEDLTDWTVTTYVKSGGSSSAELTLAVGTSMPYVFDPDDGFVYYKQEYNVSFSPSDQRDAIALADDSGTLADVVGWGKDSNYNLVGGPAGGTTVDPGNDNYGPGDGPWYTDSDPWSSTSDPTTGPGGLVPEPPPCFAAGTMISTPDGFVAVESIVPGQIVDTLDGPKAVLWAGKTRLSLTDERATHLRPIRFSADCFGTGYPYADLLLSPQHRVYRHNPYFELQFGVAGVFAAAKHLVNGTTVFVDHSLQEIEYCHLLLEGHQILFANGLTAESLLPADWVASSSSYRTNAEFTEIFSQTISLETETVQKTRAPVLKRHEALCVHP